MADPGNPNSSPTDRDSAKSPVSSCPFKPAFPSRVVDGVNLDSLGAVVEKEGDYAGYKRTDYGYVQINPDNPGPDYLLLITDPKKMTAKQKHYMRNVELSDLIQDGKIPAQLDDFMDSEAKNYRLLPESKSIYHMNGTNGGYNVKLVNDKKLHGYGPGELEVVYSTVDGKLDVSPENMPTLNRAGPDKKWGHFKKDVKPYWSHGNSPQDPTGWYRRRVGPSSPDQSDPEKNKTYQEFRKKLGE